MDTAKDMYKVYSKTSTIDLIKNRNKKIREVSRIRDMGGYWVKKDILRLVHYIAQIDAVIEARRLQEPLF